MPHFSVVAATQDWHPRESRKLRREQSRHAAVGQIELDGQQSCGPCTACKTRTAPSFTARLDRARITEVFRKGTDPAIDSYSGFFDNAKQKATGLAEWLRARWIEQLYVLGLATDYCVKFTALDARSLGFDVKLIEDGCRAVELKPGDGERAIAEMRGAGVRDRRERRDRTVGSFTQATAYGWHGRCSTESMRPQEYSPAPRRPVGRTCSSRSSRRRPRRSRSTRRSATTRTSAEPRTSTANRMAYRTPWSV